jgi:hypothetical protein
MRLPPTRVLAILCAPALALSLSACAQTVSTSGLNGESKAAAETIKDLQSNVTSGEQKKICKDDLASAVVKRLQTSPGGCQQAIKEQVTEIDALELTVESVQLGGTPAARTATAHVKSIYSGKKRKSTMSLVKEGGKWKISSFS